MKNTLVFSILLFLLTFTGCSVVSFDGMEKALAGDQKRAQLLDKSLKRYHQAVYWGDGKKASLFVNPEVRSSFLNDFSKRNSKERIVDIKISSIEMGDEYEEATVKTRVKYYKVPHQLVNVRLEKETWKFDRFSTGWTTHGVEEVESFDEEVEEEEETKPFRSTIE